MGSPSGLFEKIHHLGGVRIGNHVEIGANSCVDRGTLGDTIIEDMPDTTHRPRAFGPGNSPKTALDQYLSETDCFAVDARLNAKQLLTYHPGGYLRRIK